MSTGKQKRVLGDLTARLGSEFAAVDAGQAALPTPIPSRARSAPGHLLEFTGVSQELEQANQELEALRKEKASGFEVDIEDLRISPYQTGGLVETRIQGLVENLRNNPLNSPVVVREVELGVYEIIAGHHRVAAFKRLGRTKISAVLRQLADDEVERVVFYDNLFAPDLCDYEKYLGFSQRQKSKSLTQEQLAAEAGVSQALISGLLAFARLPKGAQEIIRSNPRAPGISASLFSALAKLEAKYEERVVEAVQRVLNGRLAATAAAAWVTAADRPAPKPAERVVVKRGREAFAEVRSRGTQWVVNFAHEADAQAYGLKLLELIKQASMQQH